MINTVTRLFSGFIRVRAPSPSRACSLKTDFVTDIALSCQAKGPFRRPMLKDLTSGQETTRSSSLRFPSSLCPFSVTTKDVPLRTASSPPLATTVGEML